VQLFFIVKSQGNLVIVVSIQGPIEENSDITISIDGKTFIQDTLTYYNSFLLIEKGFFLKPGKHTMVIESMKRKIRNEYTIKLYLFKYIIIDYEDSIYGEIERFLIDEFWYSAPIM
jgi:hypothetical protein